MPINLRMSINGGALQTGGITVALGATCQLSLLSTVGVNAQRFEIYSYPSGFALPAGWTQDTTGAVTGVKNAYYYATTSVPPVFTLTPWGKYLWRALGNANTTGGNDPSLTDDTCGCSIVSPVNALQDTAYLEDQRFGGYAKAQKANLRITETGLGGGGGGAALTVQEEGVTVGGGADCTTMNFVGLSVTATGAGATKTITHTGSFGANVVTCSGIDANAVGALALAASNVATSITIPATIPLVFGSGATVGLLRMPTGTQQIMSMAASNYSVISSTASAVTFGNVASTDTFINGFDIQLNTNSSGSTTCSGTATIWVGVGSNMGLFQGTISAGGGTKVLFVANASVNPTTNPTGGGVLFATAGALHWRGSSGTDTTLAPAEPHCDKCGRDFLHEWKNDRYDEHLAVCMPCHLDALEATNRNLTKIAEALAALGHTLDLEPVDVNAFTPTRKLAA